VSLRFALVLEPSGTMGGLREKVGSACEDSEDNEGGIFENSGTGSPGLSQIKGGP